MEYKHSKFVPCQAIFHCSPDELPGDLIGNIGKRHHPFFRFFGFPNLLDIGSPLRSRRKWKKSRTQSMVGSSVHMLSQYNFESFLRPVFPQGATVRDPSFKWLPQESGSNGGAKHCRGFRCLLTHGEEDKSLPLSSGKLAGMEIGDKGG